MKTLAVTILSVLFIGVLATACVEKRPTTTVVTPNQLPVEVKTETLESVHPEDRVETTTVVK